MEYFFDRELPTARRSKYKIQRIVLAAFVITIGWLAAARADIGAQSAKGDPHVNAGASPVIPDVTVAAPTPPTEQELAGHSLEEFILHHATTHYVNISTTGNLARWRGKRLPANCGTHPGVQRLRNGAPSLARRVRWRARGVGSAMQSQRANTLHEQPPGKNGFRHQMGDGACLSQQVCGRGAGPDSV